MMGVPRTILRLFLGIATSGIRLTSSRILPRRGCPTTAEMLRLEFERLGTAWVKLGQALALRFDVLPAEYCQELLTIRNDLRPLDHRTVRELVREELGHYPEKLFAEF